MSQRYGQEICDDILDEYRDARQKFAPFNSTHEGYAILLEEIDDLWDAIKTKGISAKEMRKEAIQCGAMIVAFIKECCDEP